MGPGLGGRKSDIIQKTKALPAPPLGVMPWGTNEGQPTLDLTGENVSRDRDPQASAPPGDLDTPGGIEGISVQEASSPRKILSKKGEISGVVDPREYPFPSLEKTRRRIRDQGIPEPLVTKRTHRRIDARGRLRMSEGSLMLRGTFIVSNSQGHRWVPCLGGWSK